jgi:homopolymeric O-antigen transport system permease protein
MESLAAKREPEATMAKQRGTSGTKGTTGAGSDRKKVRRRERSASGTPGGKRRARERTDPEAVAAPVPEAVGSGSAPSPDGAHHHLHVRTIEPPASGLRQYFAEVWRYRTAFGYFVRRYMRKRYGRTFFGYLWFVLPYVIPLFLGALVFGGILGVGVPGVPYLVYFSVTLGTWLLFSQTAYLSTRSLEITRSEVRRLYVPRLIPLAAAVTLPVLAFAFYMVMMAATAGFYVLTRGEFYLQLGPATLLVPVALAMLVVFGWACGLWFSTLAPRARDVRRLAGYVIGIWYFLTPIMYPIDQIPSGWRFLASLNPITAPVELVKDGLLNVGDVTPLGVAMYFGWLAVAIVGGLLIFVPKERRDVAFY